MKNVRAHVLLLGLLALFAAGCQEEAKWSEDDKQKMDKLFTEGIKNPPTEKGKALNEPTD
jgi:hypothetical protein